jgi:hypothetical protein
MGAIRIDFKDLEAKIANIDVVAASTKAYGERLSSDNLATLEYIEGGCSGNVATAYANIKARSDDLKNNVAEKLTKLSGSLTNLGETARDADSEIVSKISANAETATTAMGVKCGIMDSIWAGICGGVKSKLNQTAFGQMINAAYRDVKGWLSERWEDIQLWYAFEGGEMWINIAWAVLAIAAAIFTIATLGTGILAFFAFLGAVCAIIDGIAKIVSNADALIHYDEDPAWAYRLKDNEGLSDAAADFMPDSKFWNGFGKVVDITSTICAVVDLVDFSTKAITKFTGKETFFQKYIGSQGIWDSMFHDVDSSVATFDTESMRWMKLDSDGNVTKEAVDFRYRNKWTKDVEWTKKSRKETAKVVFAEMKGDAKNSLEGAKSSIKQLSNHFSGSRKMKDGMTYLLEDGKSAIKTGSTNYFKGENGKTTVGSIASKLKENFSSTMGIKSMKQDYERLDYRRFQNTKFGKNLGKIAFVGSELDKGKKVFTNVTNLMTGNFDDMSLGVQKLRKVNLPTFGTKDSLYDNLNTILH